MNMIYRGIAFNPTAKASSASQAPQEPQELCYRGQRYHVSYPVLSGEALVSRSLRYRGVNYSDQSHNLTGILHA
jgi:hypothetical protein